MTDTRSSPGSDEAGLRRIILGLFNPMPDKHPKGCLANENGPCICGYAEVAGNYLWALREAKKIAAQHYGEKEVGESVRLKEPQQLIEAARSGGAAQEAGNCGDDEDRMEKISALISRLQSTLDRWGDTCVYIRRGGLSWGAVALNRQDDDRKHGVCDLQAQHDRDMEQCVGQVERLISDRNHWRDRAIAAEASSVPSTNREGGK